MYGIKPSCIECTDYEFCIFVIGTAVEPCDFYSYRYDRLRKIKTVGDIIRENERIAAALKQSKSV